MKYWLQGIILIVLVVLIFIPNKKDRNAVNVLIQKVETPPSLRFDEDPDFPIPFGYKTQWFAIKTSDTEAVAAALHLTDQKRANWKTGLAGAEEGYYFVAPPVNGWTLVINSLMPDLEAELTSDPLSSPLKAITYLSEAFGEACYFGSHRIVDYYAWAKAKDGNISRGFGYLGETGSIILDQREVYAEEQKQNSGFDESASTNEISVPDEEDVISMAKEWTTDPGMNTGQLDKGSGIAGVRSKR
ncbi:hypothetical protein D3C75_831430 [compost metagenome]